MRFQQLDLPGLVLITPKVFEDERGFFLETYRKDQLLAAGIAVDFVQDNHSKSRKGTVRGLHYQTSPGQAKLIRCTKGAIWDIAVDIRPDSETFGKWVGVELSENNKQLIYIPIGFAHGFAVLSDEAEVQYKCSNYYDGATEAGIAWNDPEVAVDWKVSAPILSVRDQNNPPLASLRKK
ncbi:MAG: dTDP-4-dehydrorhamnose 3,5-epimerase [Candidatus Sumerlaeia bacterium]|nr:dTDP-4-dehydrorhamnose 3,5-epimerase [Candidatus Sumerlaeia bacterium]